MNNEVIKKHCSWCYNASKNKKVYTSHTLKDERGKIICPKLLKTVCRNCGKTGHVMGKFCQEPQKPKRLLLPAMSYYMPREDDSNYETGDSDCFPLSSDDEDDEEDDKRNTNQLKQLARAHPEINQNSIVSKNANPKMMQAMRSFLQEVPPSPSPPIQKTWASKLFT